MSRRNLFFLACCPKLDFFFFLEKAIFQPLLFQNIFKPQFTCGREQIIEKKIHLLKQIIEERKTPKKV